ncbi:MAG: hypothetical protein Q9160_004851 [Pyrenula sp. 1 TL-2023]
MAGNRKRAAATTQVRASKRLKKQETIGTNENDLSTAEDSTNDPREADGKSDLSRRERFTDQWITNLEEEHKKDTWAKDFQTKVIADKKELLEILSERLDAQEEKERGFQGSFRKIFTAALAPIGMTLEAETPLDICTALPVQPLHMKIARLLEASRGLTKTYQGLANKNPKTSQLEIVRGELAKEAQLARELIAAGKTTVQWDIKRHLEGENGESRRPRPSKDLTLNAMVETMLEQGREEEDTGPSWGVMAADVKRAYKRVYKIAKRLD